MRSLCKAALVVLSAVSVVVGVAPAAQAAGFSLYVDEGWLGENPSVCPAGPGFESGQTVLVQVQQGGTWVDKRTYTRPEGGYGCLTFDATALVPGPGTYSFRALSRVPSTGDIATSEPTALTLRKDDGRIQWMGDSTFQTTDDFMGFGLRLSTRKANLTPLLIARAHGQIVDLQRKAGSNWLNVSRVQAPAAGTDVTVRITIPARAGLATHRFVSRATAWSPTVITGSFTVYQAAAVNRTSYAAEARTYMAKYCPKTPILIDTRAVAERTGGNRAGQASASWGSSAGKRVLTTRIELRSGLFPDQLRFVALHECAHILQFRSMVPGRYGEVTRQATKLWPGLGVEGQADCMAYQITRDPNWFGYVRGCSKAQLVNAAKMWQTYGRKYQAATYRW
jgi:hypothetical protein